MQNITGELPQKTHTYVSADGKGDYGTIQEAIDAVPLHNSGEVIIHIAPGIYEEKIEISGDKPHITFLGEEAETTIITYGDYAGKLLEDGDITGTFRSAAVTIYSNHFTAQNITMKNSYDGTGSGGNQALAVYASGEHIIFRNCRFYGAQDTVYAKDGSQYYYQCYIQGDIDFIFGGARAVFEECEIYAYNSNEEDKDRRGYITAPSTPFGQKFGFLFIRCVTRGNFGDNTVYLGRPWHPGSDPYAVGNCVFMQCELGVHIREDGWKEQMGGFLSKNARLYEYENYGPGVAEHERRKLLTKEDAAMYTRERVLGWE